MSDNLTTGIPHPDGPGYWLVPPWATDATFGDVVRHFLRFRVWDDTNTAHLLAYYEGYDAAIDAATTDESRCPGRERWRQDLRDSVNRCAISYREKFEVEIGRQVKAS